MLDPDAAQFRDVRRCTGDRDVWRGEVNGKNRLGAFVGFKPFFYSGYRVAFSEDYDFSSMMDRCYSDLKGVKSGATASADSNVADTDIPSSTSSRQAITSGLTPNSDVDFPSDAFEEPPASPRCWADYCPCDRSNPDFGYLDVTLCRKITMGRPVSPEEFEIGAGGRDARRGLREFRERNRPISYSVTSSPTIPARRGPNLPAKPKGNPGLWVTTNDYPPRSLRERVGGITAFAVVVGANGSVEDCTVTESSGQQELDDAACALVKRRARFAPATDSEGNFIPGSYSSRVRWLLPE